MLSSNDDLEKRGVIMWGDLTNREMGTFFFCVWCTPSLYSSLGNGCIDKDKSFLPSTRGTNFEGLLCEIISHGQWHIGNK